MDVSKTAQSLRGKGRGMRLAALGLSSAAVIGLAVGMAPVYATNHQERQQARPVQAWPGYADLVEQVLPSVVGIQARRQSGREEMAQAPREFEGPEEFRRFFEEGPGGEMFERFMERFFGEESPFRAPPREFEFGPPRAMGSGFIVDADGLIVTNNHVIAGANEVTVILHDGTELDGRVIGGDDATDLALVEVETDRALQAVEFADSDKVRVGDPVIAIGSPFGLGGTVTAGIVSADKRVIGAGRYDDFLQIDAAINRGNSGGPTFDLEGRVIGVNTAIHSPTGGNVGIGFAIPANLVVSVIDDLREHGMVERGWLGVSIQTIDDDLASSLGLPGDEGALIAAVMADGPAAGAGFRQGDVILRFAGQEIAKLRDLTRAVAETDPGSEVEVVVWRDGGERTITVEIGRMPAEDQIAARTQPERQAEDDGSPEIGLALARLTPEMRERLDLGSEVDGVVVTEVRPGSPAAEKRLREGDVILEADRQAVDEPREVAEAVRAASERGDETVLLLVQRDGQNRYVALRLDRA